eukprot:6772059-Pyramimonas_sp.AAC.1
MTEQRSPITSGRLKRKRTSRRWLCLVWCAPPGGVGRGRDSAGSFSAPSAIRIPGAASGHRGPDS